MATLWSAVKCSSWRFAWRLFRRFGQLAMMCLDHAKTKNQVEGVGRSVLARR